MTIQPTFSLRKVGWTLIGVAAAAALWVVLWFSHPRQPAGPFNYHTAMSAEWPALPLFHLPGTQPPTFFDMQDILWAGEIEVAGRDAYTEPTTYETPYVYNYPRGWLLLGRLGFDRTDTRAFGLVWAALFLVAAVAGVRPVTASGALWLVAGLAAPPAIEGLGQANNDLVLFAMFVLAGFLWHQRFLGGGPAVGVLLIAGWLKLIPTVALGALLDGTRRTLVVALGGMLALGGYFALHGRDLHFISANTPRPHVHALGSQVLALRLLDGATRHPRVAGWIEGAGGMAWWSQALPLVSSAILLVVLAACGWKGCRAATSGEAVIRADLPTTYFRFSACIYIAAFAIGNNWIHREIFLLLAGPWLLVVPGRRWLAALIVLAWWFSGVERGLVYAAIQVVTWVITGGLMFYLAQSLAPALRASLPEALSRFLPGPAPGAAAMSPSQSC